MISLDLNTYVKLLEKANRSPLLNASFTLITNDQATKLKAENGFELVVSIQPLDLDELNQLRQLGLVSSNIVDGDYYKMYRIGDWLSLTILESKRRDDLRLQTIELSKRLNRIQEATQKLCLVLKLDYKVADMTLRDCILKGMMPELAKILGVEDLVGKAIPEKLN